MNSKIFSIQGTYRKNNLGVNNLLIKIIYVLDSDVDNITNNSLQSAREINFNRTFGGDNYGPFNC